MPIFGNQAAPIGSLGIATDDLFGHFNVGFIPGQGNPVPGGNLVTNHVFMTAPPLFQPSATVQLGVYTVAGAPALWTLFATSSTFVVAAGASAQWYSAPIVGVLVPGNSYTTAVLSVHAGGNPSVHYSSAGGGGLKSFIVPGVFPDPLGVVVPMQQWLLYTTYTLPDNAGGLVPALSAACN